MYIWYISLLITHLIRLLQHVDQVVGLRGVLVREQRVRGAGVVRATCATDSVHIVLRIVRVVVIDYKLHIFHICFGRASLDTRAIGNGKQKTHRERRC